MATAKEPCNRAGAVTLIHNPAKRPLFIRKEKLFALSQYTMFCKVHSMPEYRYPDRICLSRWQCEAQQRLAGHCWPSMKKHRREASCAALLDQLIKPLLTGNKVIFPLRPLLHLAVASSQVQGVLFVCFIEVTCFCASCSKVFQECSLILLVTMADRKGDAVQATPLNEGIARFYDQSSGLWEDMWGEHMHHGYYTKGQGKKSNTQAQVDMIEEVLTWAGVTKVRKVINYTEAVAFFHPSHLCFRPACTSQKSFDELTGVHLIHWISLNLDQLQAVDVGCGIGGSSRHIARKFKAETTGITLSPVQVSFSRRKSPTCSYMAKNLMTAEIITLELLWPSSFFGSQV